MISKKSALTELLSRGSRVRVAPDVPFLKLTKSRRMSGLFKFTNFLAERLNLKCLKEKLHAKFKSAK